MWKAIKNMSQKIDAFQLDQLKEIMNIGASHASTALSQMVNHKVDLTVPKAFVDEIQNIGNFIENKDQEVTAALLRIFGDASGVMFFMFAGGDESKLAELLVGDISNESEKKELQNSAIKEVGNVLAGASLTAFSKFLDMNLLHSVSNIANDTIDAIINSIVAEIGKTSGVALVFEVDFDIKEAGISTKFLFFIDPGATEKILDAIKTKY